MKWIWLVDLKKQASSSAHKHHDPKVMNNKINELYFTGSGDVTESNDEENSPSKQEYDTVVAGHDKRFREFLVFDTDRCYPEFLVIYKRK